MCSALMAASPAGAAKQTGALSPLVGGIVGVHGEATVVVAMGHFGNDEDRFFETFTSSGSGFILTTPKGAATNGGIIVSSPRADLSAVLPYFRFRATAISPLVSGRQVHGGEVVPGLAPWPTSVSMNGSLAVVTDRGEVVGAADASRRLRRITTLRELSATTAGRRCGLTALTAVVVEDDQSIAVGGRCRHSGASGIFERRVGSKQWSGLPALSPSPSSVIRLDARNGGGYSALLAAGGRVIVSVGGSGSLQKGVPSGVSNEALRAVIFLGPASNGHYAVTVTRGRGVSAREISATGPGPWIGPVLPASTQVVVPSMESRPAVAIAVQGSIMTERSLDEVSGRWAISGMQRVAIPYGTSR
ncbi:MAG: hypothetical protein WCI12_09335 [Actinomycetes bacterium]